MSSILPFSISKIYFVCKTFGHENHSKLQNNKELVLSEKGQLIDYPNFATPPFCAYSNIFVLIEHFSFEGIF